MNKWEAEMYSKMEREESDRERGELPESIPCYNRQGKIIGHVPYLTGTLLLTEDEGVTRYFVRNAHGKIHYFEVFPRKISVSTNGIILK